MTHQVRLYSLLLALSLCGCPGSLDGPAADNEREESAHHFSSRHWTWHWQRADMGAPQPRADGAPALLADGAPAPLADAGHAPPSPADSKAPIADAKALIADAKAPPAPQPDTGTPVTASGVYGPRAFGTDLNNTYVGGPDSQQVAYRFVAEQSSALKSINIYIINGESGYAAGTGGKWEITVRSDDGTSGHLPSGTALATTQLSTVPSSAKVGISWSSPATLVAGKVYHIVFNNVDSSPKSNYASLDGIWLDAQPVTADPQQPGFTNLEWMQLYKLGSSGWTATPPGRPNVITPIMDIAYANGAHQGMGYIEFWDNPPSQTKTISGSSNLVRETITVSGGDRKVAAVHVMVKRASGSGALNVRLETAAGAVIEQGSIPSSTFPTQDPSTENKDGTWGVYAFKTGPHTLASGQSYNLVFSTDASTQYSFMAMRRGPDYGYTAATYFADGHAQETSNGGSSWVAPYAWSDRNPESDWRFYFTTTN